MALFNPLNTHASIAPMQSANSTEAASFTSRTIESKADGGHSIDAFVDDNDGQPARKRMKLPQPQQQLPNPLSSLSSAHSSTSVGRCWGFRSTKRSNPAELTDTRKPTEDERKSYARANHTPTKVYPNNEIKEIATTKTSVPPPTLDSGHMPASESPSNHSSSAHTHNDSFSLSSISSTPSSPPPPCSGIFPFRWENHVDSDSPFNFIFIRQSVNHPSCKVGSLIDDPSGSLFGCECKDGICDDRCSCSTDAEAKYSFCGEYDDGAEIQRYRECSQKCSCMRYEIEHQRLQQIAEQDFDMLLKSTKHNHNTSSASPESHVHHYPIEKGKKKRIKKSHQTAHLQPKRNQNSTISTSNINNHPMPNISPTSLVASSSPSSSSLPLGPPSLPRCFNRVVGRGPINPNLELCVFRTHDGRGWGLKTLSFIKRKQYVCDYIGERIHEQLCESRGLRYARDGQMSYLYSPEARLKDQIEPEHHHHNDDYYDEDDDGDGCVSGDGSQRRHVSSRPSGCKDSHVVVHSNIHNEPYSLDAVRMGNLSRFINHSHHPNLVIVEVMIETSDTRFVHGSLFATEDISPGTELTFDYGHMSDEQEGIMGHFVCRCQTCRGANNKPNKPQMKKHKRNKKE